MMDNHGIRMPQPDEFIPDALHRLAHIAEDKKFFPSSFTRQSTDVLKRIQDMVVNFPLSPLMSPRRSR